MPTYNDQDRFDLMNAIVKHKPLTLNEVSAFVKTYFDELVFHEDPDMDQATREWIAQNFFNFFEENRSAFYGVFEQYCK